MSAVEQLTTSSQNPETAAVSWREANRRYLVTALTELRQALERSDRQAAASSQPSTTSPQQAQKMNRPAALDRLCSLFGLSSFERNILLMCAGVELDAEFAAALAKAQGNGQKPVPSFSLALARLPGACWEALSPSAPLRYWHLVEVGPGNAITTSPLRINERILNYLVGVEHPDEKLAGITDRISQQLTAASVQQLVPTHRALAEQAATVWQSSDSHEPLSVVQLCGCDETSRRAIAAAACGLLGIGLMVMPSWAIPPTPTEMDNVLRLCERETLLSNSALLLECDEMEPTDSQRSVAILRFASSMRTGLMISSPVRLRLLQRPTRVMEVQRPTHNEQRQLWVSCMEKDGGQEPGLDDSYVGRVVAQFDLSPSAIRQVWAEAVSKQGTVLSVGLWDCCRRHVRPKLDDLAQRIEPTATWNDIVLPARQEMTLRAIAAQVRHRARVYQEWGFVSKGTRGLGISALFAGPSGTGKTMAAEVLANELQLDLYRIDLSQVVSKYIGETEKNLKRVFDAAEEGGVILLFDEADALFGKRSEVKDSHDRYANIEVSYLLQRMEAYRGLAILTTNIKEALDKAFLRRIRFVVQFPFPDAAQRASIWQRIYPVQTPIEGLDYARLAQLSIPGGNIRNIALYAAFLAAESSEPVRMKHVLQAARVEYTKLERVLTAAETEGW
ncbi:MAG: ATP-binding protein [candidate division WOR-3 bacterium]